MSIDEYYTFSAMILSNTYICSVKKAQEHLLHLPRTLTLRIKVKWYSVLAELSGFPPK